MPFTVAIRHRALHRAGVGILLSLLAVSFAGGKPSHSNGQTVPASPPAETQQEISMLEQNQRVERDIASGQKHSYEILLSKREYVRMEVKWREINLGISLQLPDGKVLPLQDPLGLHRELNIEQVAESEGIYRINVYTGKRTASGRYVIQIAERHPATEDELSLQRARDLYQEYVRLMREGRQKEGRPLLTQALEIQERAAGPDSLPVASTLAFLSANYQTAGEYAPALSTLLRALRIEENELGPDNTDLALDTETLGNIYREMGDDFKAEQEYQKSLAIFEKAGQTENLTNNFMIIQLGDIYRERGDYQHAESLYQRSHRLEEKLLGTDSFHLSFSLARLGRVAYDTGKYSEAEKSFQRALALSEKILGRDRTELAPRLNDLGMLYCTTGDYEKAHASYERALAVNEQQDAMSDPTLRETLFGLARLYAAQGLTEDAVKFQARAFEFEERYLDMSLAVGSDREKLAFLSTLSAHAFRSISLHTNLSPNDPAARNLAVTTVLQRKGRAQDAMSTNLSALRERSDPEDQQLFDHFEALTAKLAGLVLSGPSNVSAAERQNQIKKLEEERDDLEGEISRRTAGFYQRSRPVTLAEIQAAVPENSALIEFAAYRPFDPKAPDNRGAYGDFRYVVYVIRNRGDVQWTDLGEAKEIDSAVDAFREALRDPLRKDAQQLARAADAKVLQPVRNLLTSDVTQLLISPDGELNLIPFQALVDEDGHYLLQRYSIGNLTTGRDLLRMQVPRTSKSAAVVVANPLFGEPETITLARENSTAARHSQSAAGRRSITTGADLSRIYFAPLAGTAREASAIQSLFPEAKVLTGAQATKSALSGVRAPTLLHIATHGFFLSDTQQEPPSPGSKGTRAIDAPTKVENPLLRSGLAMAGANLSKGSNDNGILTALEASNLNLWGTKLVTLSACDTGVGEVRNGEGVYGLRRAFFLAGTESLVMSLWPISDYVTRELMTEYYTGLKKGLGRGEALRQAQLAMMKQKGRQHPFYWASFIQSGEWANLDGKR